ncbi:MAG TPA: protein translocase subunit SecD [Burkholderiaceae bacterium]|nr:protein translocase subunit SecD [Burkholderiaceae bacterium]
MRPSRLQLFIYTLIVLSGCLIAVPNVLTDDQLERLPGWLPHQKVTLGLDLRGGSHLVLEVDEPALKRDRLEALLASLRTELRSAKIPNVITRLEQDALVVIPRETGKAEAVKEVLRRLEGPVVPSLFTTDHSGLEVEDGADGQLRVRLSEAMEQEQMKTAVDQSLEIVRRRIDEVGVAEPSIQRMGRERIVVQLPGVQDPGHIKQLLGSTAKLSFHLVRAEGELSAPGGTITLPAAEGNASYTVERIAILQGDRLVDAMPGFNPQTNEPVINFRFDTLGARRFSEITSTNVGKPFAIVLDGKVLSAPVIREPILGGSGQISGSFTLNETATLAALLRAGALPAPLHIIEERTVGPDLGSDAIRMGAITGLIGFGLVFGYMVVLYGRWGLVANLALTVNVILTFAALSVLGATLTLPGIAGIVLGIGLAVDANVLINERIREETKLGRSAFAALDAGFQRAYSTIIDSNVTTLIATLLLFSFGSGPVKGFAVTMGIGIAISMFTAVSIVRAIMAVWVDKKRPKQFLIRPLLGRPLFPDNPQIPFMNARRVGIGISLALSLASIALFVKPGLNYGIDFVGGTLIEAKTPTAADLGALRGALENLGIGEIALQELGDSSSVLIRIERQEGSGAAATAEQARQAIEQVQPGASIERVEVVGPKLSDELAYAGILSVVLASLAMLAYIWFRFEWQFALGAIATLVLDVTKTVGFFALVGLDFNLTAIAALLTLIGYSVNDKVVVYDRMRENLRRYKTLPLRELIDMSINTTLKRSLYTSVTAFLALLPMAVAGGSAVSSFAIPMLFGIVIAASSSIFIAAPILLFFGEGRLGYISSPSGAEAAALKRLSIP